MSYENIFIDDTNELIDFIHKSPSCYHSIENIKNELLNDGFTFLPECDTWELKNGGKYFTVRNYSSLIAFKIPKNDFKGFMICASHSDSPTFKIKPNHEIITEGYIKLNTERYGGMIYSTWLDRPLSVAGRIIIETENGIKTVLTNIDDDICVIPNIAIHMNSDTNKGYQFNPQTDLLPIIGSNRTKGGFLSLASEAAKTCTDRIIGFDMFLYNRQKGCIWGAEHEFFSSPKIDDLQCTFAAKKALKECVNNRSIPIMVVFDNEEVGSGTKQGGKSTFLADTLERICEVFCKSHSQYLQILSSSMMLSADNGHAVHPNAEGKSDPTNRPKMNGGIVIKYNANQHYTTDGVSEAMLKYILKKQDIPFQTFTNRSDSVGGSTLGNLSNEQVSLNTVDIGAAQLAMHSSYETGGIKDTTYLKRAITAFFDTSISDKGNGEYNITP